MLLHLHELAIPVLWSDHFARSAPLEIEIGVGKGRFLKERAQAYPDHNFLGIEKSKKWLLRAKERLEKANVKNVHLLQCYAEGFLEQFVADHAVNVYHILFPDPWPKRRHEKRRLFTKTFIDQIIRTLAPGGELHIATDHKEYFRMITDAFIPFYRNNFKLEMAQPGPFCSNFQVKYSQEGRPLYFAVARQSVH